MQRTTLITTCMLALVLVATPAMAEPQGGTPPGQEPQSGEPSGGNQTSGMGSGGGTNATIESRHDCELVVVHTYDLALHLGRLMRVVQVDPDRCYDVVVYIFGIEHRYHVG